MKKIILSLLVCSIAFSVSAQNKKELLENIKALQANQTTLSTQLQTITQSLGVLQAENATLKERLAKLEANLDSLRLQGIAAVQTSENKPATLLTALDSVQAVRLAYLKSANPEEASQYVMDVERVKPLMMKYYAEKEDWAPLEYAFGPEEKLVCIRPNVYRLEGWDEFIIKTPEGYKIDWEGTVGYKPYTEAQMKAQPNKVFELRVDIRKDFDYVNNTWVCYQDLYMNSNIYAKKTNPHVVKLDKWIEQDRKTAIIKVKWVPGNDPHFELVEFVCERWSNY